MKLLRLKTDGFGPLRGEFLFSPDRLTLVVDENERGKSSLLAALMAGLYGLDRNRIGHRVLTPLERWRPWDGGRYGIELQIACGDGHYTVCRDFDRNLTSVWNDRGQDVTADFREGKDQFPVGKRLLSLDASEFEQCAFFRQGELDVVVPDEERSRRESTLRGRLENAADSRLGDTNATEALHAIDEAAARYACPELDVTIKVETAIQRLTLKRDTLEAEIHALENDLDAASTALEDLLRLGDEERADRDALRQIENDRRAARASEIAARLYRDDESRGELELLKAELAQLVTLPVATDDTLAELRAAAGRLEEIERRHASIVARLADADAERATLDGESVGLERYASGEPHDADRLAARAEELRRIEQDLEPLLRERAEAERTLAGLGFEAERCARIAARTTSLGPDAQELLRAHPHHLLGFEAASGEAERRRAECAETLRAIDSHRRRRRVAGGILLGLGVLAGIAAAAMIERWLTLPTSWLVPAAAGAVLFASGVAFLIAASLARRTDRAEARTALAAADERLARLRERQIEYRDDLEALASRAGATDLDALLEEWAEAQRLAELRAPFLSIDIQVARLERRRDELVSESQAMLDRWDGGVAAPATLDLAAAGIRWRLAARQRFDEFARRHEALDSERRDAENAIDAIRSFVRDLFARANVAFDDDAPLGPQIERIAEAASRASRRLLLETELVPQAEARLLAEPERDGLERQLAALGRPRGTDDPIEKDPVEMDEGIASLREKIEGLARLREERRTRFEERQALLRARLVDALGELERAERALARASRFKRSTDLARATLDRVAWDTHRRWADFLNHRVGEIVRSIGTEIEQVRFGEDLDFSVRLPGGAAATRGRAMLQLSSGARDQLHFAVRVAISEFLSNGAPPLPLLIDDCFATSDDARARAGMRFLIEHLSQRHQIVMVTCHRRRHEALAAEDRELYERGVHWIDARAVAAAA